DLRGGAGNDTLWGGADGDRLEGEAGQDTLYGGGGIDFLVLDHGANANVNGDVLHGHFGNAVAFDTADDNATDILLIEGTPNDDTILISEDVEGRLVVAINGFASIVDWRDANGTPVVEQIQVSGLGGNDDLGFAEGSGAVDFSELSARSDDYLGVLLGGSGNDTLRGTAGADRIEGGSGSDVLYGYAGDDQLWGDLGDGQASDHDVFYAGQGNDDLIGGSGTNDLYAWSRDPELGG
ncbi:hypothetical protein EYC98_21600, partial [Halieaceae bacterium IMCC14734]|nr:hypothetical protein [Candidatus Litorirhabdus singularis]